MDSELVVFYQWQSSGTYNGHENNQVYNIY